MVSSALPISQTDGEAAEVPGNIGPREAPGDIGEDW